jgi:ribosomal protein S18 acetylase RimI-like enzyme
VIVVRAATAADSDAVRRIVDDAFAPLRRIYRPNPDAIAHAAALPLERLVAVSGDEVAGTVQWRVDGDRLRVVGLAVAPAWQRRGVGRALVEHLAQLGREQRCSALALFTIVQTGNVAVFRRLGFGVMWERPDTWSISVSGEPLAEAYLERAI